jgi:hypothetical protein
MEKSMTGQYETPLSSRYASQYMLELFSADTRYRTWRKLWVALAKAEMELGLPVTQEQVDELAAHIDDIDYECVKQREKEVRHDVMAHVYAYGKAAPGAAGIIHLGATSCYVTDNADLVIYRDGLRHLRGALLGAMKSLCDFTAGRTVIGRTVAHHCHSDDCAVLGGDNTYFCAIVPVVDAWVGLHHIGCIEHRSRENSCNIVCILCIVRCI